MENIRFSKCISWQHIPKLEYAFVYNIITKTYYEFFEINYYIWMTIYGKQPVDLNGIVLEICKEYDVSKEMATADCKEFINQLYLFHLVEYDN